MRWSIFLTEREPVTFMEVTLPGTVPGYHPLAPGMYMYRGVHKLITDCTKPWPPRGSCSLPLTRPGKETAAAHPLRASPRAVLHRICSRKARGGQGSMPSTPALPSLFLPRVTSRRVAGAPPPLILGRESSHLRRIVATRTVRVVCGAHLPLCVRDHQRRPYRDALTALDDTSSWPTAECNNTSINE